jgi:hypothetical protein
MTLCSRCKSEIRKEEKLKKADRRTYWPQLIEHIKIKWEYRYRPDGKFDPTGQDMALLRRKTRVYAVWDVMALYDEFIATNDPFYRKCGYSIACFCGALPIFLDGSGWKLRGIKYHDLLDPMFSKETLDIAMRATKVMNHVAAIQKQELKREGRV